MLWRNEAEMLDNWDKVMRLRGRSKDILFVLNPDSTTHLHHSIVYGLVESGLTVIEPAFSTFRQDITVIGLE